MPYEVIKKFEKEVADWCGAPFGIAVESGTAAIFLSLAYMVNAKGYDVPAVIPSHTYPSVPCSIIHNGLKVKFEPIPWKGIYQISPYGIFDCALRFRPEMYHALRGGFACLSFHNKKHLPIGRGGMILTDNEDAAAWFRKARFDGRDECALLDDDFTMLGYNFYMTPEQAARGLQLFSTIKHTIPEDLCVTKQRYPDLSKFRIYQ